jgi:hypothetical protein
VSCRFGKPDRSATPAAVAAALTRALPVAKPALSGKTLTVSGAGWATASWFVCNADLLGIGTVKYAGKRWSYSSGWKDDGGVSDSAVVATMAH